jgi:hypothetical protein
MELCASQNDKRKETEKILKTERDLTLKKNQNTINMGNADEKGVGGAGVITGARQCCICFDTVNFAKRKFSESIVLKM